MPWREGGSTGTGGQGQPDCVLPGVLEWSVPPFTLLPQSKPYMSSCFFIFILFISSYLAVYNGGTSGLHYFFLYCLFIYFLFVTLLRVSTLNPNREPSTLHSIP
jgi:hypothetical protein